MEIAEIVAIAVAITVNEAAVMWEVRQVTIVVTEIATGIEAIEEIVTGIGIETESVKVAIEIIIADVGNANLATEMVMIDAVEIQADRCLKVIVAVLEAIGQSENVLIMTAREELHAPNIVEAKTIPKLKEPLRHLRRPKIQPKHHST